ncbi:MAG: SpoIID/LytB domain-containing protein [Flavobacteriales bacterium]|nr:SpoIID/LytB domain-containing protein [Flavobacteriales bacterium]
MRVTVLFTLLFTSISLPAITNFETIDIGILDRVNSTVVQVIPEMGKFAVIADGQNKATLRAGERVSFSLVSGKVKVTFPGNSIGLFKEVRLMSLTDHGFFRIYVLAPKKEERVYDDHLHVTPLRRELRLINRVSLEKYVAGAVEAESGKEKELEFYKVQAIISRTYALSNKRKYLSKGFNLSDEVDSQVYHGKCRWEPLILRAVRETEGKVLVDSEMGLVTAAFHSNSGGETVSSESVWSKRLPYLSPRKDEFSSLGKHSTWERTFSKSSWLSYLEKKHNLAVNDRLVASMATNYQQEKRQVFFIDPEFNIPLKTIRKDWGLKSTFFSIEEFADSVRFSGRGFGHGIGLSQEGAIRMAELGFSYLDVLHFYYNDVHVIDLRALEFFREE